MHCDPRHHWWSTSPERQTFAESLKAFPQGGIYRHFQKTDSNGHVSEKWTEGAAMFLHPSDITKSDVCVFRSDDQHCDITVLSPLLQAEMDTLWNTDDDGDDFRDTTQGLEFILSHLRGTANRPASYKATLDLGFGKSTEAEGGTNLLAFALAHHHPVLGNPRKLDKSLGIPNLYLATSPADIIVRLGTKGLASDAGLRLRQHLWTDMSGVRPLYQSAPFRNEYPAAGFQTCPTVTGLHLSDNGVLNYTLMHDPDGMTDFGRNGGDTWWSVNDQGEGDYTTECLDGIADQLRREIEEGGSSFLKTVRSRI